MTSFPYFSDAAGPEIAVDPTILDDIKQLIAAPQPTTINYVTSIPGTETSNSTCVYRLDSPLSKDESVCKSPIPGHPEIKSLAQMVEIAAKAFGKRPYLAARERIESADQQAQWSGYKCYSYTQTWNQVRALGRALDLGVKVPQNKFTNLSGKEETLKMVGIWAKTSLEWRLLDFACNYRRMVSVPIYDSLGPESLKYIIETTKLSVLAVEGSKIDECLKLKQQGIDLQAVIAFEPPSDAQKKAYEEAGLPLFYQKDLRSQYMDVEDTVPASELEPSIDDIATLIFTSGTTGTPKGAVHTNRSLLSMCTGYLHSGNRMRIGFQTEVVFCFLPVAHIYQRAVELIVSLFGATLGYFSGDLTNILNDLQALQPTVFIGVPRIYSKMLANIQKQIQAKPFFIQWVAKQALSSKTHSYSNNSQAFHAMWPDWVFSKIRATFGGRLRSFSMGSAPMDSQEILELQMYFSAPICEGWGMTECGIVFLQDAFDNSKGTIGGPLETLEFKIQSIPEKNYSALDEQPKGELLIRGPCIMREYFQDAERTAEAIDSDGWLHTGDVVALMPNGAIKIIDRAKNIFKLAQGEYIAPERLEIIFGQSDWIENLIVHGDSLKPSLVSIIAPSKPRVERWAKEQSMKCESAEDYEGLLQNEKLRKDILSDLEKLGRSQQLKGYELIRACRLTNEPFTVDNGMLTPTLKLVRSVASKRFEKEFSACYKDIEASGVRE